MCYTASTRIQGKRRPLIFHMTFHWNFQNIAAEEKAVVSKTCKVSLLYRNRTSIEAVIRKSDICECVMKEET